MHKRTNKRMDEWLGADYCPASTGVLFLQTIVVTFNGTFAKLIVYR